MSNVILKGNASGTGTVTLESPNTNSDRTISFPDSDGTVAFNNQLGMRNRIINGDMRIDQRNAGASVTITTDTQYTVDRWAGRTSAAASKFSVQQNAGSVTPPDGFKNYLGVTSLSSYSLGASDYYTIQQHIEGYNIADLGFGTATAKTVTLSFWVRSSLTGTFGGSLINQTFSRCYPFSYTISSANTWTQISITVAGETSGTWNTTNGHGLQVVFSLGMGSTYSGTAGAWTSSTILAPTGATSVVGTNGATFYLTGVQLEVGSAATNFDFRSYGQELALCQRYYFKNAPTSIANSGLGAGFQSSTTNAVVYVSLPVTMRSTPTMVISNTLISDNALYDANVTLSTIYFTPTGGYVNLDSASVGAQFRPCMWRTLSSGSIGYASYNAEL